MAVRQRHDGLLDVRLDAAGAFERFLFALANQRVDASHLDVEQTFDRLFDLRLRRGPADPEDHLVGLRGERRLFGDDRSDDDVIVMRIKRKFTAAHLKRASRASIAALVKTSLSRRKMSYTLMPCTGSTSICGMLRAARRKFASGSAPSMIRALVRPILAKLAFKPFVLASAAVASDQTMMPPPCALADSACFRANARTFFGRSCACERTTGPKARPPPRNCGTRAEPWRAEPVPFCLYIFLPVRAISARFFTAWVPARRLASW